MRGTRALLVSASMVAVVLAGCATVGSEVNMEGPDWKPGYHWAFDITNEETGFEIIDGEEEPIDESERFKFRMEVANTTVVVDGERLYHSVTQVTEDGEERNPWFDIRRARDLATVGFGFSTMSGCAQGDCGSMTIGFTEYHLDALTLVDFPLHTGKRWVDEETEEIEEGLIVGVAIDGHVQGGALVDTGVGQVEAARIVRTERPIGIDAYERFVIEEAEAEGYDVQEYNIDFSAQQILYWSDTYQTFVRSDEVVTYEEKVRADGPEGQIEYHVRVSETTTSILEGARLVAGPEVPIDDLGSYLLGEQLVRDPTGQAVAEVSYTLTMDPPSGVTNAAEPATSFDAVVTGDGAEGHTFHWSTLDREGNVVDTGEGTSYIPAPGKPGRFTVQLETRNANGTVAAVGGALVADWIATQTMGCGPATVWPMGCDDIDIPLHAGAKSVRVAVSPLTPTVSSLTLRSPLGYTISSSVEGSERVAFQDDFQFIMLDGQDWSVSHSPTAATGPVAVDVEIIYSGASVQATSSMLPETPWSQRIGGNSFL